MISTFSFGVFLMFGYVINFSWVDEVTDDDFEDDVPLTVRKCQLSQQKKKSNVTQKQTVRDDAGNSHHFMFVIQSGVFYSLESFYSCFSSNLLWYSWNKCLGPCYFVFSFIFSLYSSTLEHSATASPLVDKLQNSFQLFVFKTNMAFSSNLIQLIQFYFGCHLKFLIDCFFL